MKEELKDKIDDFLFDVYVETAVVDIDNGVDFEYYGDLEKLYKKMKQLVDEIEEEIKKESK